MLGETENQFSVTRVALSTGGAAKSKFLSVYQFFLSVSPPVVTFLSFLVMAVWMAASPNSPAQSPTADSFNPGCDNQVGSLAVQTDGKILAGGWFSVLGGRPCTNLGRLNPDGSFDTAFKAATVDVGYCTAIQADGKVLTAGFVNVARFNADGNLDAAFNAPIVAADVDCMPVQADGKILVSGDLSALCGQTRSYIGRLNADGTLDTAFNPGADLNMMALALQPDGKILAGGAFTQLAGQSRACVGRLSASGSLDTSFSSLVGGNVFALVVQADGKVLVGGSFVNVGGQSHTNIARLNSNGTVDSAFNAQADNVVNGIVLQADGKILLSGYFSMLDGQSRSHIGRLNASGTLDTTFNPGANDTVRALTVQADGKVLVCGDFTTLGGQPRNHIGRLNSTDAATQSLAFNGSTLTWLRGGASPEVWRTTFDICTNGADWISLGAGTRITGGWQRTGLNFPTNAILRARGFVCSANWFVETTQVPTLPLAFARANGTGAGSNGLFTARLTGTTGASAVVESSPDLRAWTPWTTNTLPAGGCDLSLPIGTNRQQFFRARVSQ